MRPSFFLESFLCVIILASCQEEEHFLEIPESKTRVDSAVVDLTLQQNRWIYGQMRENYFWAEQLRDSSAYDFSLNPGIFYKSMLVNDDRFSYYENNEYYSPPTKGKNLNATVKVDSIYEVKGRRVGYFYYSGFETEADITDVFLKMKGVDELVVDVRDNPGGFIATCVYLASLIAPKESAGKLFCSYRYNDRWSEYYRNTTGDPRTFDYFRDDIITLNRSLNLDRVFILTDVRSASCSELLINGLRPYMKVTVIGGKTVGKDVGMRACQTQACSIKLWPVTFRTYNAVGDSVPKTGIIPDIPVTNSQPNRLGETEEPLLRCALQQISLSAGQE